MTKKTLSEKKLGLDSVLETEHLDDHGSPDGISIDGTVVCVYGVSMDNENSYGRRFGGQAFLAFGGGIGCLHT